MDLWSPNVVPCSYTFVTPPIEPLSIYFSPFGMSFAAQNNDYILVVRRRRAKIVPFTSQEEQEQPP